MRTDFVPGAFVGAVVMAGFNRRDSSKEKLLHYTYGHWLGETCKIVKT